MKKTMFINSFLKILLIATIIFFLNSCAELQTILEQAASATAGSDNETERGLKEALRIGTINAVDLLHAPDGFLEDELVKIILPPEAKTVIDNIKIIPGGKKIINDLILRMNRAAEYAVAKAKPIFHDVIASITINDAVHILFGEDTAATDFLRSRSFSHLEELFLPIINNALDQNLVGNISSNRAWSMFTRTVNRIAASPAGEIVGLASIDVELGPYVCDRALDGLFLKIGDEERKIRENPVARVTDILKKVFGRLDN